MSEVQALLFKGPALENLKSNLAKDLFGMTKEEALAQELCISCKQPAMSYCYSDAGVREYQISGLCEKCFDQITGGGDE